MIICYFCYLLVTSATLYLLFYRQRPNRKFAYITFYAMTCVTMMFFITYIYESVTLVSGMKTNLIEHIEENKAANPTLIAVIKMSHCCTIDENSHTKENFQSFQMKYPNTCGTIAFDQAASCLQFIKNQRNLTIFYSCIMIILRILILILLWKYIKEEYSNSNNETTNHSGTNNERSATNSIA
ncbi:hypothetical protein I4U23_018390 [Adineta vaga]|nr:hypothetical protein I4U23_018390 [Adineta vaga]